MRFHATLELGGKTATGIQVPDDVVVALGGGKRPAVSVTLNTFTYRTTVASLGGRYMIPVSADVRAQAGVAAGDELDVEIALDNAPRVVTLPADFAAALDADANARHFYDGLAYSHQRRHVDAIEDAKTPETRQRRIEKSVSMLHDGKA